MRRLVAALIASAGLGMSVQISASADDAILVLDASGSMWGQIEGVSKVEIAREVVGGLLDDLPADRRLGLMAYGHHRRGDCNDIEMVAPVGADRQSIRETVNGLNAVGMTPISESVRRAAEELRYREQAATVILVSDGEETCSVDPCEVGAELEASGLDFTAHIIGFDITTEDGRADLQCLADTTGGKFILASNAGELTQALQEAVVEEPAPAEAVVTTATLTLQATELADGPIVEEGLAWTVIRAGVGDSVYASPAEGEGSAETEVEPGVYDVAVVRPSDGLQAQGRARVEPDQDQTLTLALNPVFEATVAAEPAGSAPAGSEVVVTWTGPDRPGDWIGVAAPDFNDRSYLAYTYTRDGSPLSVRLPDEPGDYEIRYVLGSPATTLARIAITATPVEALVEGPTSVSAEAPIPVTWTGPNYPNDYIATAPVGSRDEEYLTYSYTRDGSPLEVRAPSEAGQYELRYVTNQSRAVLARAAFEVVANAASVTVPASAPVGSVVEVTWTGPNNQGDYLSTAEPGSPGSDYITYEYTRGGSPTGVQLPAEPGTYEIRYILSQSNTTIASATIEATAVEATLTAPQTAPAGSEVPVEWTGPAYSSDYVAVAEAGSEDGAYINYFNARQPGTESLQLPDEPGEYEIRYVLGQDRSVLARVAITTTPVEATLDGPDAAPAGAEIAVSWTGPGYSADYISIAEAGSDDGSYVEYGMTRSGNPTDVATPDEPGDYEIRYVLGQSRTVLARRAITIE